MSILQSLHDIFELWLRDFTGREWLLQRVQEFLDDPKLPRFLLIVGEPGIGKSSFATFLWQHIRIPDAVHFCIGGYGSTTEPLRFIESVAEQLSEQIPGFGQALVDAQQTFADRSVIITTTQMIESVQRGQVTGVSIEHLEVRGLPPETAFDRLIRSPLQSLDEEGNLPQTVILVDSLDEAVTHASHPHIVDILTQAQDLPTQVRFILTSRPDPGIRNSFADEPHVVIDAQGLENQGDIARYLTHILQRDKELQKALAGAGWDKARFVHDLGETSEWNFLYLSLVLPEIAAGDFRLGEDTLPRGLDGYYRHMLSTRQGLENWNRWGADLMEIVLALQEPATLEQIASYLGWPKRQTLQRLGQMSQLLDPALQEQKRYWRHHWSVISFLADQERAGHFWCEGQQGHARIAEWYLTAWGGLDANLPGLQDPAKRDLHSGYGLRHLAIHLEASGRADDLHILLAMETAEQHNAWYEAQEGSGRIAQYIADVQRAWRWSEEAFVTRGSQVAVGLQCRYALIISSLRSLSANLPPTLLSALVQGKIWSPIRGLTHARHIPDLKQRMETLVRLLPHLPDPLQQEVLVDVRNIENNDELRAKTLSHMALRLPESLQRQVLAEALEMVQKVHDESARAAILVEIFSNLPEPLREPLLREVWTIARETKFRGDETWVIANLAPYLPERLLEECLNLVIKADYWEATGLDHWELTRTEALISLVPHLPKRLWPKALTLARKIGSGWWRGADLPVLATSLPEALLGEVLTPARELQKRELMFYHPDRYVKVLTQLVLYLPEALLEEALIAVRELPDVLELKGSRDLSAITPKAEVLIKLASRLQGESLKEALEIAREMDNSWRRDKALSGLVVHLIQYSVREALAAAREICLEEYRAKALCESAPRLTSESLEQALVIARTIKHRWWRAEALGALAIRLPIPLQKRTLEDALAAVQRIEDVDAQPEAMVGLAPGLSEGLLESVLAAVPLASEYSQVRSLKALIPHLPDELLEEVMAIAREMTDFDDPQRVIADVVPYLCEQSRAQELRNTFVAVCKMGDGEYQAEAFTRLAPYLCEEMLREALTAARKIEQEWFRVEALAGLIPYLPGQLQEDVTSAALAMVHELGVSKQYRHQANALVSLAQHVPEELAVDVLTAVRAIDAREWRIFALTNMIQYLPDPLRTEVIEEALILVEKEEWWIDSGLDKLASHLPEAILTNALAKVREIKRDWLRASNLIDLAPYLPEPLNYKALQDALASTFALSIKYPADREAQVRMLARLAPHLVRLPAEVLIPLWQNVLSLLAARTRREMLTDLGALSPVLIKLGGATGTEEAFRAIQDVSRWWP